MIDTLKKQVNKNTMVNKVSTQKRSHRDCRTNPLLGLMKEKSKITNNNNN